MGITIKIDSTRLTFGDLLALEDAQEGKRPFHSLGQIISKFIVNDNDEYLNPDEAIDVLRPLSMTQINDITQQFSNAVQEAQKSAVPPIKGGS